MSDRAISSASLPNLESADVLIEAIDVSKRFDVSEPWLNRILERKPKRYLHAVDRLSFHIKKGETFGLVGESGCGKSTVARLLVGLYSCSDGQVRFEGHPIQHLDRIKINGKVSLRQKIQMIFQDPYASLNPRWTVGDIVAEPLKVHYLLEDQTAIRERVAMLLAQVGLAASDAARYPHQFSGGQRQRISIARALASEPEFLVCDEPTSALDVSVQAQVLNLMKDLQQSRGLTYLFISHNLAVVRHVSDRVGVMYLGRLVEVASNQALFEKALHPYTRMLLDAIPDLERTGKDRTPVAGEVPNPLAPPSGCAFHPRCPHAMPQCARERPELRLVDASRQVACFAYGDDRANPN
ncbi:MAG: ABC transporter ATP-binding protein [Betaproteobacteria bacterium]